MERERVFYKSRGLPNPKDQTGADDEANGGPEEAVKGQDYHRLDEQVRRSYMAMRFWTGYRLGEGCLVPFPAFCIFWTIHGVLFTKG